MKRSWLSSFNWKSTDLNICYGAFPEERSMKCLKCQEENRETRKFCTKYGAALIIKCHRCGSDNLPGELFCGECGQDLRAPKEPTPIDYAQPQSYTPKHLADKILTTRSTLEGERKLVTVLFVDVAARSWN
jgi:hypothetical protein